MTLAATLAFAEPPAKQRLTERTWFLPVRVGTRAAIRPGTNGAIRFDTAIQPVRARHLLTELNLGWTAPTGLLLEDEVWPRRQNSISVGADLLYAPVPLLGIGPSFDLDYRWYRQEWVTVGDTWVPTLGLVVDVQVLRGPWYSLSVNTEARVDLVRTELQVAERGSARLSPVALELGLRFAFGHGRPPGTRRTEGS